MLVLMSQHSRAADSADRPCGTSLGTTSVTVCHLLKRRPLPQLRQCCLIAGRLLCLQDLQHEGPPEDQTA